MGGFPPFYKAEESKEYAWQTDSEGQVWVKEYVNFDDDVALPTFNVQEKCDCGSLPKM